MHSVQYALAFTNRNYKNYYRHFEKKILINILKSSLLIEFLKICFIS